MKKTIFSLLFLAGLLMFGLNALPVRAQGDDGGAKPPIYVLDMKGAVGPAYAEYIKTGLAKAHEGKAQLVVLRLNTPGGLLTSTRDIVSDIIASPVPVAIWVTPSGAHAASAGTFMLYAAHIAAMDDGTNVGAATPIDLGGGTPKPDAKGEGEDAPEKGGDSAVEAKALEDTKAFIRSIAEIRGRNVEWAEKAITEAKSITAREALEKNVIDHVSGSLDELLRQIDGKSVDIKNGEAVTLETADAEIIEHAPDWRTLFLSYITDPNVAFILMSIGVYGLILEFYNPGSLIPGTIGAISLVVGLFALNILPVNAAGIALIALAVVLLIAEVFVPSFGILGFGGVAAFVIGAAILFDTSGMGGLALDYGLLAGTGIFGLILVAILVWLTRKAYLRKVTTGQESMIGETAIIEQWDGHKGYVLVQGERWQAQSERLLELAQGEKVVVTGSARLTLTISRKAHL